MDAFNSFYNGISGINAMSHRLDVTANNVANANTNAFKTGRATFADMLETYQGDLGVGHGVQLGSIGTSFAAGSLEKTSNSTDMAITGEGFFQLRDGNSSTAGLYTRDGQFKLVDQGTAPNTFNLVTSGGQFVQGYNLNSGTVSSAVVSDILVNSTTPQSATTQVDVVVNLENNRSWVEETNAPLYAGWDGQNSASPIADSSYEYKTTMQIYGAPDAGNTNPVASTISDDLTVYFDSTTNPNEKEFLVTCDPSVDQRLIGGTTHYSTADKGAGALLYGVLHFSQSGDLDNIECWKVPPDGNLVPTSDNQIQLGRGESYFSFDYNLSGSSSNNSATINFGCTPKPQAAESGGRAFTDAEAASTVASTSTWDSIFDAQGHQVKTGDVITFQGTSGDSTPQAYSYTVDTSQTLETMLSGLQQQFACKAEVINGTLTLTDTVMGTSQLAINSISYRSATGATPATDPSLAQIFGPNGSAFVVDQGNRFSSGPLATTSYASSSTTLFQHQNGYGKGMLDSIYVDSKGTIVGKYSNGQDVPQSRLVLANFNNLQGLRAEGGTTYSATDESGGPLLGTVGQGGLGGVTNNALEMSNVDMGREMADLIFNQRAFQANAKSITTSDEIFQDVLQLIRR